MKRIIEGFSDLTELRQRDIVKCNLKEDLGNKELAIDRNLSFLKAAKLRIGSDKIVLRLYMYDFPLSMRL